MIDAKENADPVERRKQFFQEKSDYTPESKLQLQVETILHGSKLAVIRKGTLYIGAFKQGRQFGKGAEHWMTDVIEVLIWNP